METIYVCRACSNTCKVKVKYTEETTRIHPPDGCVYDYSKWIAAGWYEVVDDSIQTEDSMDRAMKVSLDVGPGRKVSIHVS